jgi:hypothetical protein
MKKLSCVIGLLAMAALSAVAQVSVSTAIEPALNAPARFGVSAAISAPLPPTWVDGWSTAKNFVSVRYGTGRTILGGLSRNFVEFLPGLTLVGDVQAGVAGRREMVLYGAGVATDLGDGFSVTYGLHVNKISGSRMYPSGYVSLAYTFGR